jgi:hypothetical protein
MTGPGTPEKILLIRTGALGDTVLLLPLIRFLRAAYPDSRIAVMTHPEFFPLVLGPGLAHETHPADCKGIETFYLDCPGTTDPETAEFFSGYDWVISVKHDPDRVFERNVKAAGVKHVWTIPPLPPPGFSDLYQKYLFSFFSLERWEETSLGMPPPKVDVRVFANRPVHPKIPYWDALAEIGISSNFKRRIDQLIEKGFVTVHPGSGSLYKNWPGESFLHLIDGVIRSTDLDLLVIRGPAEGGEDPGIELQGDRTWSADNLPISLLSSLLKRSRCHVGNDSGVSHLAAGLDCPTICLFGPTSPAVWRPIGDRVAVVSGVAECSPCDGLFPDSLLPVPWVMTG